MVERCCGNGGCVLEGMTGGMNDVFDGALGHNQMCWSRWRSPSDPLRQGRPGRRILVPFASQGWRAQAEGIAGSADGRTRGAAAPAW